MVARAGKLTVRPGDYVVMGRVRHEIQTTMRVERSKLQFFAPRVVMGRYLREMRKRIPLLQIRRFLYGDSNVLPINVALQVGRTTLFLGELGTFHAPELKPLQDLCLQVVEEKGLGKYAGSLYHATFGKKLPKGPTDASELLPLLAVDEAATNQLMLDIVRYGRSPYGRPKEVDEYLELFASSPEQLSELLGSLDGNLAELLIRYYGLDDGVCQTAKEIAADLGLKTKAALYTFRFRALQLLQRELECRDAQHQWDTCVTDDEKRYVPIAVLRLPKNVERALREYHSPVFRLGQLVRLSRQKVCRMKGIGPAGMHDIEAALERLGLKLAD